MFKFFFSLKRLPSSVHTSLVAHAVELCCLVMACIDIQESSYMSIKITFGTVKGGLYNQRYTGCRK